MLNIQVSLGQERIYYCYFNLQLRECWIEIHCVDWGEVSDGVQTGSQSVVCRATQQSIYHGRQLTQLVQPCLSHRLLFPPPRQDAVLGNLKLCIAFIVIRE